MKKTTIIYWSGTGNTEAMANFIVDGIKSQGGEVDVINVSEATIDDVENSDIVVLGSPSMGSEVIEEGEMEPFVESISTLVGGKQLALFGSYGWGDGEWMRNWQERMEGVGALMIDDGLTIQGMPENENADLCIELGKKIAKM